MVKCWWVCTVWILYPIFECNFITFTVRSSSQTLIPQSSCDRPLASCTHLSNISDCCSWEDPAHVSTTRLYVVTWWPLALKYQLLQLIQHVASFGFTRLLHRKLLSTCTFWNIKIMSNASIIKTYSLHQEIKCFKNRLDLSRMSSNSKYVVQTSNLKSFHPKILKKSSHILKNCKNADIGN